MLFTRRQVIQAAAAAAAVSSFPICAAGAKKVRIAVGGQHLYYYVPLTVAYQLGYFKDEGLDVEIIDFQGGSKSLQAVVGGSADVVSGAFEHTINMQSRGQRMTAFVLQGRAPQVVFAVNKKTMPNYKGLADLKGKNIGVTSPGSSSQVIANYVLATAGLKASDVSFIGVGSSSQAVAAVRTGQVDALANLDPVIAILQQDGLIEIAADTRKIEESDKLFKGPLVAGCLYAMNSYIEANPEIIAGLAAGIVRANQWLATASGEDIVKVVPESFFLGNKELYVKCFLENRPALSKDGLIPDEAPEISYQALQSVNPKIAAAKIDTKVVYTNKYVEAALKRYPAKK